VALATHSDNKVRQNASRKEKKSQLFCVFVLTCGLIGVFDMKTWHESRKNVPVVAFMSFMAKKSRYFFVL
jgi:hypothetical protein